MSAEASEEGIRVFVRIRPLNKREIADKQTIGWDFNSTDILEDTQNGQRVYSFDRCYSPDEKNKEVYDLVGKPVILKAMEGYNGTVFTCKFIYIDLSVLRCWSCIFKGCVVTWLCTWF